MGLAPLLIKEIFNIIDRHQQERTTVLLVEQNANMALSIANRAYVLETGRITLSGAQKSSRPARTSARPTLAADVFPVAFAVRQELWNPWRMYPYQDQENRRGGF